MKFSFQIFIGVLFFNSAFAQNTQSIDSLRSIFKDITLNDSIRFEASYNASLLQMRSSLDSARVTGFKMLDFSKSTDNREWEATSYKVIGNTYAIRGEFEDARDYFFKSHEILKELNDKKGLTTTNNNIGTVFYELGNYIQAQDYLLESLKLAEELEDDNAASRALNNLGNVHNDLRNNEQALEYYTKSLDIKKALGQKRRFPAAYNNIGLIYSNLKQYKPAIDNLTQSAQIAEELGDKRSESRAYNNLGIIYSAKGNYKEALNYFNNSITIKSSINDKDGLAFAYLYRGKNYLATKKFRQAQADCLKSLDMADLSGALNLQKEACECISDTYEGLGNYKTALVYNQRFVLLKDSIFNSEKAQEITRNEMNYQFEKQQLADSIAYHIKETTQKVAHQKDLNKQYRKFYITLITSLIIIGLLLYIYSKHKQNLKLKNLENELLNSEIEFKQNDLTNLAVNISNNQEWAESLAERLKVLKASSGKERINELENLETAIKNKIWVNNSSDDFYKKIDELSSSFYNRLTSSFKGLTKTEIRLCSLIKLNLNTKQIAILQNINPSSVKMSRNRLRKKLSLTPDDDLSAFLRSF